MSNYTQTTYFTPKDTLPTSNPAKTIFGAAYDVEFGNIATAITSKYDSSTTNITLSGTLTAGALTTAGVLTAGSLVVTAGGTTFVGEVTISAAASGTSLAVTGGANAYAGFFYGSSTTGQSQGLLVEAGTNSNDFALNVSNQAATKSLFIVHGDGSGSIGNNGSTNTIQFSAGGAVSVAAPTSGQAFTATGNNGGNAGLFLGSSSTGGSLGISIIAGTNASDYPLAINSYASTQLMRLFGDGHGYLGWNGSANTIQWSAAGNVTIPAPSSGVAFTANGYANQSTVSIVGSSTSGQSYGLQITAGTTSADNAVYVANNAGHVLLETFGDGHGYIGYNGSGSTISWAAGGQVTIAAPSNGNTLQVNAVNSGYAIVGAGGSTSGQSYGLYIAAGSTSADDAVRILNTYQTAEYFRIKGDGSGFLGPSTSLNLSWNTAGAVSVAAPSSGVAFTVNGVSGTHSTQIADSGTTLHNAGYLEVPQNSQSSNYTCVLADNGKSMYATASITFTIPANGSVAYPVGTVLTFATNSTATATIAITTDTMYLATTGSTGSRTLAPYGMATALKVATTTWLISGAGLT